MVNFFNPWHKSYTAMTKEMVNFFNPWHKSYAAMTDEISIMTTPRDRSASSAQQDAFVRERDVEYYQLFTKKERIYRINGWCSLIKYAYLKNFSSEWRECVLRVNQLSEKILVPRKEEKFFYSQVILTIQNKIEPIFSPNHIEAFSAFKSQNQTKSYEEARGREHISGYHVYRARGVFSWIKYAILKRTSSDWTELHVKIWDISEKILVKRSDKAPLIGVRYALPYSDAEMKNIIQADRSGR